MWCGVDAVEGAVVVGVVAADILVLSKDRFAWYVASQFRPGLCVQAGRA